MNTLTSFTLASSLIAGFLAWSTPQPSTSPTARPSASATQAGDEPTELEGVMATLKTGQRDLRKLIEEPEANQEALLLVLVGMEAAAHQAIMLTPKQAGAVEKDMLPAWTVAYKLKMTSLLSDLLTMQDAALRADAEDLKTAYDAIGATKKSGHQTFRD